MPTFDYNTYADKYASDFNAVVPDVADVPALSAAVTRKGDELYVLLVNRTTDRVIHAAINLRAGQAAGVGDCRTLVGELDLPGAKIKIDPLRPADLAEHQVPPFSAQVLRIPLSGS